MSYWNNRRNNYDSAKASRQREEQRNSHAKFTRGHPTEILLAMRQDLAKPPPSEEWYVKKWWRLRRDAVIEELEDREAI